MGSHISLLSSSFRFRPRRPRGLLTLAALVAFLVAPSNSAAGPASPGASECSAAPCYVLVTKVGSGSGLVTSDPPRLFCGDVCMAITDYEERMTLLPTPDPGSVFTGWASNCDAVSENRCELHFDIAKEVTAIFDLEGAPPTPPPSPPPPVSSDRSPSDHLPLGTPCTIKGSARADVLRGTPGRDVICGRGGNDTIYGRAGHDLVLGGGGNDRLYGGLGREHLVGGPGDDFLSGGGGDDELFGARGADLLRARDAVIDLVHGGLGRDRARVDEYDLVRSIERRI